jgi:hypothetical protein
MKGPVTAAHDERECSQAVLLVDECECGLGPDCLLADGSLSSAAVVWVTALSALALARSSRLVRGTRYSVCGDCPHGEARHAELIGGGARLLEEPAALG